MGPVKPQKNTIFFASSRRIFSGKPKMNTRPLFKNLVPELTKPEK